jgi:hypothetical protein
MTNETQTEKKILKLRDKLLKDLKKEYIKKGGLFENFGVKQEREFSEKLKSGEYGHYYIDKLYNYEEGFNSIINNCDDNKVKMILNIK